MPTIGVFDSGVGGLTVLQALRSRLPEQDFVYVGDTARAPYGRKPRLMVRSFALEIAAFLEKQNVDGIVVACNTASSAALPELEEASRVPVWGVVDPGVDAACAVTRTRSVGVIGTQGTIASGAYQERLEKRGLKVWAQACPTFVHLVEEGLADSPEARLLAQFYLARRPTIDTLILGCTHYPLMRSTLRGVLGDSVVLVDGASRIADEVHRWFAADPQPHRTGHIVHYVTGDVTAYRHTASVIGGVDGEIVALDVTRLPHPPRDRRRTLILEQPSSPCAFAVDLSSVPSEV